MAETKDCPDVTGHAVGEAKDPEDGNEASTEAVEDRREEPPESASQSWWFRFVFGVFTRSDPSVYSCLILSDGID